MFGSHPLRQKSPVNRRVCWTFLFVRLLEFSDFRVGTALELAVFALEQRVFLVKNRVQIRFCYIKRCSVLRLSFCFLLHLCFGDNTLYRKSRLISLGNQAAVYRIFLERNQIIHTETMYVLLSIALNASRRQMIAPVPLGTEALSSSLKAPVICVGGLMLFLISMGCS